MCYFYFKVTLGNYIAIDYCCGRWSKEPPARERGTGVRAESSVQAMLGSFSYGVDNWALSPGNALGLAKYVCEDHLTTEGKTVSHLSGSFCGVLNPLHLLVALPLGFYRIRISVREAESCTGTELGSCQHIDWPNHWGRSQIKGAWMDHRAANGAGHWSSLLHSRSLSSPHLERHSQSIRDEAHLSSSVWNALPRLCSGSPLNTTFHLVCSFLTLKGRRLPAQWPFPKKTAFPWWIWPPLVS